MRTERSGDDAADQPVADLLEHELGRGVRRNVVPASASAIAIAMKNSGTQRPSLSPLSTLSPWRIRDGIALVGDDRLAERGVGAREHDREHERLGEADSRHDRRADQRLRRGS